MPRYDLIIIGSGPAGLSAALTAKNRNLDFLLFGSRHISEKVQKAHLITNYLGLPEISGARLADTFLKQIDQEEIPIREDRIAAVYSMGDYFTVQAGSEYLEASAVILAAGVSQAKSYPGEAGLLGQGVSYCATCDAAFFRGKPVAVIGGSPKEEGEASFLADVASSVTYFPLYREDTSLPDSVHVIREKVIDVTKEGKLVQVVTEQNTYPFDGVFILRASIAPDQLVPGIRTENGRVVVNRNMQTNLPGLFAAGDITGTPYQYMKAAGEGNVAAIRAAGYILEKKK